MTEADDASLIHYIERLMTIIECLNKILKGIYEDYDKNPFPQ